MFRTLLFTLLATAVSIGLSGCAPTDHDHGPVPSGAAHAHGDEPGHDHDAGGPHGGHVIELGDEQYHAELVHGDESGTVTVFLYDGQVKKPVTTDQAAIKLQLLVDGEFVDYALAAVPGEKDAAAGASCFRIVDAALSKALDETDRARGRLNVEIGGESFIGDIEHKAHDADHDHDDAAGHRHDDDEHDEGHDHGDGDRDHDKDR